MILDISKFDNNQIPWLSCPLWYFNGRNASLQIQHTQQLHHILVNFHAIVWNSYELKSVQNLINNLRSLALSIKSAFSFHIRDLFSRSLSLYKQKMSKLKQIYFIIILSQDCTEKLIRFVYASVTCLPRRFDYHQWTNDFVWFLIY